MAWTLEPHQDGSWAVLHGERLAIEGLSRARAIRYVRVHRRAGEKVNQAAPDGYRSDITGQFIR
jgi:hypothetical protein